MSQDHIPNKYLISPFVHKLLDILSPEKRSEFSSIIRWEDDGKSFLILKPRKFSSKVSPLYFKHSNYTSFIRQLNCYGFSKVKSTSRVSSPQGVFEIAQVVDEAQKFKHSHFQRDDPSYLYLISRKPTKNSRPKVPHNRFVEFQMPAQVPLSSETNLLSNGENESTMMMMKKDDSQQRNDSTSVLNEYLHPQYHQQQQQQQQQQQPQLQNHQTFQSSSSNIIHNKSFTSLQSTSNNPSSFPSNACDHHTGGVNSQFILPSIQSVLSSLSPTSPYYNNNSSNSCFSNISRDIPPMTRSTYPQCLHPYLSSSSSSLHSDSNINSLNVSVGSVSTVSSTSSIYLLCNSDSKNEPASAEKRNYLYSSPQ